MKQATILLVIYLSANIGLSQGFITSRGTSMVDGQGNDIQLKGICLANWLVPEGYMLQLGNVDSPRKINTLLTELIGEARAQEFWKTYLENYITKKDIQFIKEQGFNHVRLFIHYKLLTDDDYLGQNRQGYEQIDNIVRWCQETGLFVLLDMHCAPCGQSGENYDDSYGYPWLLRSEVCQQKLINVWKEIANRYKNNPVVMGYDLLNAPLAPYFGEDMNQLNHSLVNLYKETIKAIREIDKNHLIFVQFPEYHENLNAMEGLESENIVFSFQRYFTETNQSAVQKYIDFAERHQAPVYVCEAGENTLQWIGDMRKLFDENKLSWCFHPYKEIQGSIFYIESKDPSSVVGIKKPKNWNVISEFGALDRSSFSTIRENKPAPELVKKILEEFLENCKFENCIVSDVFIHALGLK